ncbi:hypothetical protein [Halanaeroarchaeum sp. HSR-CO]|uniref:transcriptional regulator FilR1 domain-containing protein n=1 Tax=Halanaeroarchaeum sp. HSR-CO TaxID=2866382 RepID=UPI00217E9B0D|nr:hypothetical protein [Halanaeroarchaeum sp. HSR-CO]
MKRTLQEFDERGWIHERDGEITQSVGGAFILDAYEDFTDRAELVDELRPFFSRIAKEDCDAGPTAFEDATVIEMDPAYPFATVEYVQERYREASEHANVLLTYVSIGLLKKITEVAREGDIDRTIVLDQTVQEAIETRPEYHELFTEQTTGADLYVLDEEFPFTCGIIDDHAILTVSDDDGLPSVLLGTSNEAFLEVIERRFRTVFERARPL